MVRSPVSNNPDDGFFQVLTPKGSQIRHSTEPEFRLGPMGQLELRVALMEKIICQIPWLGINYGNELRQLGLERLDKTYRV